MKFRSMSDLPLSDGDEQKPSTPEVLCLVPECPAYRIYGSFYCAGHQAEVLQRQRFEDWMCGIEEQKDLNYE